MSKYYSYSSKYQVDILNLYIEAERTQDKTQTELLDAVNKIIESVYATDKRTPKYIGEQLRAFANALHSRLFKVNVTYLYNVNGKLYKTGSSKDLDLPHWSTLSDCDFAGKGAFYYRNTLNLFFKSEV